MLIVAIALLMLPVILSLAETRTEVDFVVTNGSFRYTIPADFVSGYLRSVMLKYDNLMVSTATVEQVWTDAGGILKTSNWQNLFFTNLTDGIWLPNKGVNAGEKDDVWIFTAPSTNSIKCSGRASFSDMPQ